MRGLILMFPQNAKNFEVNMNKANSNKYLVSPFPPAPFKRGRPKNFGKKCLVGRAGGNVIFYFSKKNICLVPFWRVGRERGNMTFVSAFLADT